MMERDEILQMDDTALSALCRLEFYKDSGPGGQKRNKTSSAARVTLPGWEITTADCTERSQSRNRANALQKLRIALALNVRITPARAPERLECALSHPDYPLWLAQMLDVYFEKELDHKAAAEVLGISPTAFIKKLFRDPVVWQKIGQELTARNRPMLKAPK